MKARFIIALMAFAYFATTVSAYCAPTWHQAFDEMCLRLSAECAPYNDSDPSFVKMTPKLMTQLVAVNIVVNHAITYTSDQEHNGQLDYWDYPADGKGDCEDYALEKRRRLVEMGWPRRAMRMAIVSLKDIDMLHAVMLINTNKGILVLDMNVNDIRDVSKIYLLDHIVAIQSANDPRHWIEAK